MILANGCYITKSDKFKGVWILSVPTVYIYKTWAFDLSLEQLFWDFDVLFDLFKHFILIL